MAWILTQGGTLINSDHVVYMETDATRDVVAKLHGESDVYVIGHRQDKSGADMTLCEITNRLIAGDSFDVTADSVIVRYAESMA